MLCQFGCSCATCTYAYEIFDLMTNVMGVCLQVVLVANSLPALNDVTAMEVPDIVAEAAKVCILYTDLSDL